jgi:ABC-type glycerol-3-phosphate transport system permease component
MVVGRHWLGRLRTVLSHAVLMLVGLAFLLPLAMLVSTSLKSKLQNSLVPPMWVPNPLHFENYADGLTMVPFALFLRNTMVITVAEVSGVLLSSALVAYGFARIRWRGRNVLFLLVISTMLLPYEVTLIPVYIIFSNIGWVNTFYPLTVPYFFGSAFYIFLLRQFFMTIPQEISEAGRIDGCSEFRIFAQLVLPLAKPALAAIALFQFVAAWNDFLGPLIYLNDQSLYTLSLGLQYFRTALYQVNVGAQAAYALVIALPVILVFFVAQRQFIQGISLTGIKT